MRPKSLALLLMALGCGLVASIGITRVMKRGDGDAVAADGQGICVAAADVGMGDLLNPTMFKFEDWPKDKIPEGALTQLKNVENRRTRTRLYKGEPILDNRLFPAGTSQQGASAMITKGYRLATVKVDPVSGGGSMILPGDHVDVMVHFVRDPHRQIRETVTRTILQDVKVFAVDDVVEVDKEKGGKSINAKTITLLVTPKQAQIVMAATQLGVVNMVLRSPEPEAAAENIETRTAELFGGKFSSPNDDEEKPEPPKAKEPVVVAVAPPVEKAKPRPTWNIRVLKPKGIDEVKFEQETPDNAADPVWKLMTGGGVAPDAAAAKEPPKEPAKEPAKEPPAAAPPQDADVPAPLPPSGGSPETR